MHGFMTRIYDITGETFGSLTAVERLESRGGRSVWRFDCECGGSYVGLAQSVKCGDLQHCADCRSIRRSEACSKHGASSRKGNARLYNTWVAMRSRCNTPTIPNYRNYGARGIRVCHEWDDFTAFRDWALENGYTDELTIDRIDVDGNYEPSNCRWLTLTEQAQNKRHHRLVEYQGKTYNFAQLARLAGVGWQTMRQRLEAGLTPDEAVNHPRRGYLPTRRNYGGVRA